MEYKLINGNSLEVLKTLEENSIDSIVTDPPYELGFMGKSWDKTGIAFNVELWEQALRVLKPGGHLIAFSGSRTYHRMAVAIEDAGFEIRDQIMWLYSTGFPKSLDISKAIDKKFGVEREVIGISDNDRPNSQVKCGMGFDRSLDVGQEHKTLTLTLPSTEEAKKWSGYGTSLKPAHEPIVLARKPLSEKTVAENVLKWGTGAINIDECRVEYENTPNPATNPKYRKNNGYKQPEKGQKSDGAINFISSKNEINDLGRWPANLIHDGSDEVQSIFPNTSPSKKSSRGKGIDSATFKNPNGFEDSVRGHNDNGGNASRYFYCAKANKKDRNDGLDGFEEKRPDTRTESGMGSFDEKGVAKQKNHHPTVKPTDLMQYLVKLITPKGGTVLDPFNGSGSTGKACAILKDRNYKYIGIDLSQEYLDISKARIENEINNK